MEGWKNWCVDSQCGWIWMETDADAEKTETEMEIEMDMDLDKCVDEKIVTDSWMDGGMDGWLAGLAAVELVERLMTDVTAAEDKKIQAEILDEFAKGSTVVTASCFGFAWFGCFRWLEVRRIGKSARQEKSRSLRLCKPLAEKRRSWASSTSDEALVGVAGELVRANPNMADEDAHDFETGDAGAAHTYPQQAGEVRKGSHLMIKGRPCKCVEVSTSKTGKHGHAKAHIVAIDIFTGKKMEDLCPVSHNLEVPFVKREVSLLQENGDTKEPQNAETCPGELLSHVCEDDLNLPCFVKIGEPTEEETWLQDQRARRSTNVRRGRRCFLV
eukprot:s7301_g1.t2